MQSWAEIKQFVAEVYGAANAGRGNWTPRKLLIQPYIYVSAFNAANNNALAHGSTQTATLTIAANADFVITSLRYRAWISDASRDVVPAVNILITDSGSNEQYSSQAVDISNMFGQIGKAEYDYMFPRIVNGRSALTIQATSYATAEDYAQLSLAFAGAKVQDFN